MFKVVQTFLFWIWKFFIHLESTCVKGKLKWELIRKQNPVLLSKLRSIFLHIKFSSLYKVLCPTFNVRLETLLHVLSLSRASTRQWKWRNRKNSARSKENRTSVLKLNSGAVMHKTTGCTQRLFSRHISKKCSSVWHHLLCECWRTIHLCCCCG